VSYQPEHPSDWTLELLAEDELGPAEHAKVAAHVEGCSRCAAELDTYRSLFAAMSEMPSFAPSMEFTDTVMARVTIVPHRSPAQWLLRWLPKTQRGWMILFGLSLIPALPVLALFAWIATHPGVTPGLLWDAAMTWTGNTGWSLLVNATGTLVESSAVAWGRTGVERLLAIPLEILIVGILVTAVGIPLSAWTLYRTLSAPSEGNVYAH
jgi:anti-sigma factor RsiW